MMRLYTLTDAEVHKHMGCGPDLYIGLGSRGGFAGATTFHTATLLCGRIRIGSRLRFHSIWLMANWHTASGICISILVVPLLQALPDEPCSLLQIKSHQNVSLLGRGFTFVGDIDINITIAIPSLLFLVADIILWQSFPDTCSNHETLEP